MKEDLRTTRWSRLAVRIDVPTTGGVFLLAANVAGEPGEVLLVGSAPNLRQRLLELLASEELRSIGARTIHWVAGLSLEQARLAERLFVRRYNPKLNLSPPSRYLDILAG